MIYYVYLIKSNSGKIYVGSTNDLERRMGEHNAHSNKSKFTNQSDSWTLQYAKRFGSETEARQYERKIKNSRFARDTFYKEAQLSGIGSIG